MINKIIYLLFESLLIFRILRQKNKISLNFQNGKTNLFLYVDMRV